MKTTIKTGLSAAMAVAMFATTFVPAQAFAVPMPKAGVSQSSDVEQVQYRRRHGGWYHGHRGYRHERRGYRRHSDGWWYPLAAFGAGAIIGGAIANDGYSRPRYEGINPRHTDWCYARYRSYRAYDNTFQPNYGPRRECLSPYY
ncbi:BA14K family protein [Shinella zoogloeoides]|uniref:BA14K family protein n=1 Tax=Shinella zoogloeoides TaxID=352475 RepID=UPI000E65D092|nr:BA14K family protein [Shinella zoogloeoides]WPE22049.1 Lectin-like protein BA14k [Shinella zoogloeoides]